MINDMCAGWMDAQVCSPSSWCSHVLQSRGQTAAATPHLCILLGCHGF